VDGWDATASLPSALVPLYAGYRWADDGALPSAGGPAVHRPSAGGPAVHRLRRGVPLYTGRWRAERRRTAIGGGPAVHRLRRVRQRRTAIGRGFRCTPAAAGVTAAYCHRRGGPAVHRPLAGVTAAYCHRRGGSRCTPSIGWCNGGVLPLAGGPAVHWPFAPVGCCYILCGVCASVSAFRSCNLGIIFEN
jgi:hypothetical protein